MGDGYGIGGLAGWWTSGLSGGLRTAWRMDRLENDSCFWMSFLGKIGRWTDLETLHFCGLFVFFALCIAYGILPEG